MELYHYGVKGMRWGVRRNREPTVSRPQKKKAMSDKTKRRLKRGAAVAGTVLLVYGSYKVLGKNANRKDVVKAISTGKTAAESVLNSPVASQPVSSIKLTLTPSGGFGSSDMSRLMSNAGRLQNEALSGSVAVGKTAQAVDNINDELLKKLLKG